MALEISYYGGGASARPIEGSLLDSSETRTLSAISQKSADTPPAAVLVSVLATEPARVAYGEDGVVIASATSHFMAPGERITLDAQRGYKIAGKTP